MRSEAYQFLDTLPAAKYRRTTGFFENYQAALGQFVDENLSISRWLNDGPIRQSKNTLNSYRESGKLSDQEYNQFAVPGSDGVYINWDRLIDYTNKKFGMELQSHTSMRENIRSELDMRREYATGVMQNASKSGIIGQFFGTFNAAAIDPIALPSYFLGFGTAAKGAGFLARVAKGAMVGGAVEGITEAAIQPFVFSWKSYTSP